MSWILGLFVIAAAFVFAIDYCGFLGEIERYLGIVLKSKVQLRIPKPFSCSLCMTFWTGLIYLMIVGKLSFISFLILILFCANTKNILHGLYTIQDLIECILNYFDLLIGWFKK